MAAHHFGLSRTDLFDMTFKSVDAIFADDQQKEKIRNDLVLFSANLEE